MAHFLSKETSMPPSSQPNFGGISPRGVADVRAPRSKEAKLQGYYYFSNRPTTVSNVMPVSHRAYGIYGQARTVNAYGHPKTRGCVFFAGIAQMFILRMLKTI